jgi:hypothetical protein
MACASSTRRKKPGSTNRGVDRDVVACRSRRSKSPRGSGPTLEVIPAVQPEPLHANLKDVRSLGDGYDDGLWRDCVVPRWIN